MSAADTVIYRDIEEQLSEDTRQTVRELRVITKYGPNMTAGTLCDILKEVNKSSEASDINDAAFLYDSQFDGALA